MIDPEQHQTRVLHMCHPNDLEGTTPSHHDVASLSALF